MFLPFSRLRILASSIQKGRTGPRRGSRCITIANSLPYLTTLANIQYPVYFSIIRALFFSYGFENRIRSEVKDFIHVLPCTSAEETTLHFLNKVFPNFISTKGLKGLAIPTGIFSNQRNFLAHHRVRFRDLPLVSENYLTEDTIFYPERLPFCMAADTRGDFEMLPDIISAKLAIKFLHNTDFEKTTLVVKKNEKADALFSILTDKTSYRNFIDSLKKGEEESLPLLREFQKIATISKRSAILGNLERIKILLTAERMGPFDMVMAEQFQDTFAESLFKVSHGCKYSETLKQKEIILKNRKKTLSYFPIWNALSSHHTLENLR